MHFYFTFFLPHCYFFATDLQVPESFGNVHVAAGAGDTGAAVEKGRRTTSAAHSLPFQQVGHYRGGAATYGVS